MAKPALYLTHYSPTTLLIGIEVPYNRLGQLDAYFEEFLNLTKTDQVDPTKTLFIKLRTIDPAYFFSKGKRQEIKKICEESKIERIILSEQLSPQQIRNLEDYLDCDVMDRTDLILDIFEKTALSAEGKTQVGIALLQHQKTRLAGKGIHMEQQAGITGLRGGFGEKAKERQRRYIEQQIYKLQQQLKTIAKSRDVQRKQRLKRKILHICLIGYTNAGKSTILNALTKSELPAEDKLFVTLDTTTRALFIAGKQKGVISDTVGFIQNLPHHLVEAFKSTLSELKYADLLVQVVDVSDSNWESHITVVQNILDQLDVHKEMLYVFNKADKIKTNDALIAQINDYQPNVLISAKNKKDMMPLISFLRSWKPS